VLVLTLVYVFQGMIFTSLRLFGFVPLLLPIISTGIAVYEGSVTGGIVGIFAGVLCDVSFNEPVGVFTVLLTLTGLIVGTLADTVMTRGFATYFTCCVAVLLLSAFVQLFPLWLFVRIPLQDLGATALRQTLYSLVFTLPLWFFARAFRGRAERVGRV